MDASAGVFGHEVRVRPPRRSPTQRLHQARRDDAARGVVQAQARQGDVLGRERVDGALRVGEGGAVGTLGDGVRGKRNLTLERIRQHVRDESRYPPELLQGDGGIAPRARGGGEGVFLRLGGGSEEG